MYCSTPPIVRRFVSLSFTLLSSLLLLAVVPVHGQPATLNGITINIPAVVVGETIYTIDLTLIPDSDPITFNLTAAAEVPDAETTGASTFQGITLTIPSIQVNDTNFLVRLNLSNEDPVQFQLADFSVNESSAGNDALTLFEANVSSQIVDSRCVVCHVDGGVASDTEIIFQNGGSDSLTENFGQLQSFINSRSDSRDYILTKVSGGNGHGGGVQLPAGSADYNALQSFIDTVLGTGSTASASDISFFSNVELLSAEATLRRAAIILAGRVPSEAEYSAVANGDEAALKATIRNLMVGENFHQFLLDGANDRLLVRGIQDVNFLDGGGVFPNFLNPLDDFIREDFNNGVQGSFRMSRFSRGVDHGLRESPLELIAHVVENDLPYSEILTADYMMLNPIASSAVEGTGTYDNPEDYSEFRPARIPRYYTRSEETELETFAPTQSDRIVNPGSSIFEYPHAGVLNTIAFLMRYPTTPTNRNRARARWTFLHFLDVDIEQSAPRTQDPIALADTNNPTMFNENCTVCHTRMDPVAAAFQDYADEHHYKANGSDSLDPFYRYPEDGNSSLYQEGDTWYRDMRSPGLKGVAAPPGEDTLQWLAQEIVGDPGFSQAAVKFWWPSVVGNELLTLPEVQTDADYQARLMAYDAQSSSIQEMSDRFASGGMKLKDLLVDMIVSPWFSAGTTNGAIDPTQAQAHEIAGLRSERLLTAEQLAKKTKALTGFAWNTNYSSQRDAVEYGLGVGFEFESYGLYYGAIDSFGVTKRATEMTALMSTVATTHASESACPIVIRDFALPDGQRLLFNGISKWLTPQTAGGEQAIREKLVELHDKLFGIQYGVDSTDITDAYQLYLDSWNDVRNSPNASELSNIFGGSSQLRCSWWSDFDVGDGLPVSEPHKISFQYLDFPFLEISDEVSNFLVNSTDDPQFAKRAWITVMFYMLSHYDYLYE